MTDIPRSQSDGPLLAPWGTVLWPLSGLYAGLGTLRAGLYRRNWRRAVRLPVPVISVGNLTAGGSGKTPVVAWIARAALAAGRHPAILSRGHGRRGKSDLVRLVGAGLPGGAGGPDGAGGPTSFWTVDPLSVGDEPLWLSRTLPGVPVVMAKSRAAAGRLAMVTEAPDLFVLDDGFQHLSLRRDLNLLLIDAMRGMGNGRVLPSGWLREPLRAARRADAVIVTQANQGDPERALAPVRHLLRPEVPIFEFGYRAVALRRLEAGLAGNGPINPAQRIDGGNLRDSVMITDTVELADLAGLDVIALCGIARPEAFTETLTALGGRVVEGIAGRDHEPYDPALLTRLDARLAASGEAGPLWITTEKDAVKLRGRLENGHRLWVLEMDVSADKEWAGFFADFLAQHPAPSPGNPRGVRG